MSATSRTSNAPNLHVNTANFHHSLPMFDSKHQFNSTSKINPNLPYTPAAKMSASSNYNNNNPSYRYQTARTPVENKTTSFTYSTRRNSATNINAANPSLYNTYQQKPNYPPGPTEFSSPLRRSYANTSNVLNTLSNVPIPTTPQLYKQTLESLEHAYNNRIQHLSETIVRSLSNIQSDAAIQTLKQDATSAEFVNSRMGEILSSAINIDREAILSDTIKQLVNKQQELEQLSKSYQELQLKVNSQQQDLQLRTENLEEERLKLINQLDNSSNNRTQAEQIISSLQMQLDQANSDAQNLQNDLYKTQQGILNAENYAHNTENQAKQLHSELEIANEKLIETQEYLHDAQLSYERLKGTATQQNHAIVSDFEEKINSLQQQITALQAENHSTSEKNKKLSKRLTLVTSERKLTSEKNAELTAEITVLQQYKASLAAAEDKISKLAIENTGLSNKTQDIQQFVAELQQKHEKNIANLQETHAKTTIPRELFEQTVKLSVEERLIDLTKNYLTPEQHSELLTSEIQRVRAQEAASYHGRLLAQQNSAQEQLNSERNKLLQQLNSVSAISEGQGQRYSTEISEKNNAIVQLNELLQQEQHNSAQLHSNLTQQNGIIEKLQQGIDGERKKFSENKAEFNAERAKMGAELQNTQEHIQKLTNLAAEQEQTQLQTAQDLRALRNSVLIYKNKFDSAKQLLKLLKLQAKQEFSQFSSQFSTAQQQVLLQLRALEKAKQQLQQEVQQFSLKSSQHAAQITNLTALGESHQKSLFGIFTVLTNYVQIPLRIQRSIVNNDSSEITVLQANHELQALLSNYLTENKARHLELSHQLQQAEQSKLNLSNDLQLTSNEFQTFRQQSLLDLELQKAKLSDYYKAEINRLNKSLLDLENSFGVEKRIIQAEHEKQLSSQAQAMEDLLSVMKEEKYKKNDKIRLGIRTNSASEASTPLHSAHNLLDAEQSGAIPRTLLKAAENSRPRAELSLSNLSTQSLVGSVDVSNFQSPDVDRKQRVQQLLDRVNNSLSSPLEPASITAHINTTTNTDTQPNTTTTTTTISISKPTEASSAASNHGGNNSSSVVSSSALASLRAARELNRQSMALLDNNKLY
jgi:hypothetical protein